jgi:hypothetical protein
VRLVKSRLGIGGLDAAGEHEEVVTFGSRANKHSGGH